MTAMGQTLPMDSAPVPPYVRYCSKSDHLRRECEMTLRANLRHDDGRYSITSSASANSLSGTMRPSALAVLRLISRSNLVGRSIGKSARFIP